MVSRLLKRLREAAHQRRTALRRQLTIVLISCLHEKPQVRQNRHFHFHQHFARNCLLVEKQIRECLMKSRREMLETVVMPLLRLPKLEAQIGRTDLILMPLR